MKKSIVYVILSVCFLSTQAQNWNPISLDSKYHFKDDTATVISNTIFIDSLEVVDGDSLFFLNRIITSCDSCENDEYRLKNQPQFLNLVANKMSDGVWLFEGDDDFYLRPNDTVGAEWLFDATNSISASILKASTRTFFGITDSVKSILLSNGDSIIISKTMGILKFPLGNGMNYNLVGFEEDAQSMGELPPEFWDFYSFEVGDILQYINYETVAGPGGGQESFEKKITIESKDVIGNTIKYYTTFKSKTYKAPRDNPSETWYDSSTDEMTFVNSKLHDANAYQNQLVSVLDGYGKSTYFKDNGIYKMETGDSIYELLDEHSDVLVLMKNYSGYKQTFTEGLGMLTTINEEMFWSAYGFVGRVSDGDTIGIVKPDEYFVGKQDLLLTPISIYPNPVSTMLNIECDAMINSLSILNISGKKVKTINDEFQRVNLSDIPAGIYFIRIISDKGIINRKIIKN